MDAKTISRLTLTSYHGISLLQYLEAYLDQIRLESDFEGFQFYRLFNRFNLGYYDFRQPQIELIVEKEHNYMKYILYIGGDSVCRTKNIFELLKALKKYLA